MASEPSVGQHQQKGAVEQKSHEKRHLPSQCVSGWKLQQIAKLKSLNETWVVLGGGTCDQQYTAIHRIYLQKLSKWIYLPQFGWH